MWEVWENLVNGRTVYLVMRFNGERAVTFVETFNKRESAERVARELNGF